MKKIFLMPCVYVYKIVKLFFYFIRLFFIGLYVSIKKLSSIIYQLIKYFLYGVIFTIMLIPKGVSSWIIKFCYGFIVVCFLLYKWFKYIIYGVYFPFVFISDKYRIINDKSKAKKEEKRIEKLRKQVERKLERQRKEEMRVIEKARILEKKKKLKEEKLERRRKQNDQYVNENITLEKQGLNYKLNQFLRYFNNLPEKIKEGFNKWYNNLTFVRNKKNRYEMEHQELLINFEGEDAIKSTEKIPYEYVVKDADGKIIKGHYEAYSKVEVHSYLLSENYEVYSIKTSRWIQLKYSRNTQTRTKFKVKDLVFFLTQLSTYIKSGIPLVEALKILVRQYKNKNYQQIIKNVVYELTMGESFSEGMIKQGNAFPKLLVNMIKTAEMTGELPETLDDMANYYTETDKTRKQMVTAMTYPLIILVLAIAVIVFVLIYVVPKFTDIYASMGNNEIPSFTKLVMDVSTFLKTSYLTIIIVIVVIIIIFRYLYKNIKAFKTIIQWLLMHTPVFGNVIIFNEVTMFTKTFSSLLKHNVFITDSMEILTKVTNNEIYKMIILDTISNLAHGDKLSMAFKNHWAFPIPAYEMLVTGEKTGQLPEMMAKVSEYYQELHRNAVTRIKTFIEPILIIFLTVIVGGIVLAIIVPMFSLYESVSVE